MGALSLTGKSSIREPFAPFGLDVRFVPYGDADALRAAVSPDCAAVFLEPTQGEGGVVPAPDGYLQAARAACDEAGALLVLDEIQSGMGRTGAWFAFQREGVIPDVITLAKGLGGGLPIGACIGIGGCGSALGKGDHGSTFGGNPVACAAALAVLDTIESDGLLANVTEVGDRLAADDRGHRAPAGHRGARQRAVAGDRARGPGGGRGGGRGAAGRVPGQRGPAGRDPARAAADPQRRAGRLVHRRAARDPVVGQRAGRAGGVMTGTAADGRKQPPVRHFLRDDDLTPPSRPRCWRWPPG